MKVHMTIQEAQKTVDEWINTIGIRYYNELTNTAILMEEVGEVARLMARLYGEQSRVPAPSAPLAPPRLPAVSVRRSVLVDEPVH